MPNQSSGQLGTSFFFLSDAIRSADVVCVSNCVAKVAIGVRLMLNALHYGTCVANFKDLLVQSLGGLDQ